MDQIALFLNKYYTPDVARVVATLLICMAGLTLTRLWSSYLQRSTTVKDQATLRERLVLAKNIVWITAGLIIFTIWASKIAGIILSLAAVAGATLIVSKELLMCLLGYFMLTATRAYRVGDYIEVNGMKGRVIDIHVFSTTLAETGPTNQVTGKSISMPNSLMLGYAVRNSSATGQYVVHILTIVVPNDIDLELAEKAAIDAANKVTQSWQQAADAHFERIEGTEFLDLPSSRPKLLWQTLDSKSHSMSIRFGCPMVSRVNAEQEIFKSFWKTYKQLSSKQKETEKA